MNTALSFELTNHLPELDVLARKVEEFSTAAALGETEQFHLNLMLDELVTNIIRYAYADEAEHRIEIDLRATAEGFEASVTDDGVAFNPLEKAPPQLDAPLDERPVGGLGIHLVRRLVDQIEYQRIDERNRLRFSKKTRGD